MSNDTAYKAWNRLWATPEGRANWQEPEPMVAGALPLLRQRGVRRALDLGCGVGRHAVFLAREGFEVHAVDASEEALRQTTAAAQAAGVRLTTRLSLMSGLPYQPEHFDLVLAWNVIYHGTPAEVRQVLQEIRRVLRPGGLYVGTLLSKRDPLYGQGREVAPHTYVIDSSEADDKGHPHFYCDEAELRALFHEFRLLSLDEHPHARPGSYHWHLMAER